MPTTGKRNSIVLACLGAAVCASLAAAPARASDSQVTVLQDDPKIVFAPNTDVLDRTLTRVKALGVDTVRVSLFWHLVAPSARSKQRPDFGSYGPTWPGSYPQANWDRYDRIVTEAQDHGLGVLFSVTGPAPAWASGGSRGQESAVRPDPKDFEDFVQAVGARYSGSYSPEYDDRTRKGLPLFGSDPPQQPALPRVSSWSIWNEPNFPAWLYPQWRRVGRAPLPTSPLLYRRLVDAAWRGFGASGHGSDTILLGETAPYGPHDPRRAKRNSLVSPLMFVRELYCVTRSYQPYGGAAARRRGCPTTAESRRRFADVHPGLFRTTGWAHHAYSITRPPTFRGRRLDVAPLGAIDALEDTLDSAQSRWGAEGGWPVWITEYGYQTLPPDPFRGVHWGRQAAWMSWAEYLAYRDPRIGAFAQFLLVDDGPRRGFRQRDPRRWITWQSGFITAGGRLKPAYEEFKRPIYVAPRRVRPGGQVRVFGIYRVAGDGMPLHAEIELNSGGSWETLRSFDLHDEKGYLFASVTPPRSGRLRILWSDPSTGEGGATRPVPVAVRR
jgi:hypothetical protein